MTAELLFDDEWIAVSEDAVTIRRTGAIFAVAGITSVSVSTRNAWRALQSLGLLVSFAAVTPTMCAIACTADATSKHSLAGFTYIALGFAAYLLFGWLSPKEHVVCIGANGATQQIVYSKDPAWSERVRAAIQAAMIARATRR